MSSNTRTSSAQSAVLTVGKPVGVEVGWLVGSGDDGAAVVGIGVVGRAEGCLVGLAVGMVDGWPVGFRVGNAEVGAEVDGATDGDCVGSNDGTGDAVGPGVS